MSFIDLFKPKWKHSNPGIRKKAVAGITNQNILASIAMNEDDWKIRNIAMENLTDTDAIIMVANKKKDGFIPETFIKKISDQKLLEYIAKNNPDESTRRYAIEQIEDPYTLAEIIKTEKDWNVANFAFRILESKYPDKLTNEKEFWDNMRNEFKRKQEEEDRYNDSLRDAYDNMSNMDPHESPFGFKR